MIQKNKNGYKRHACWTWLAAFVFTLTLPVFYSCSGDDNGETASANANANNAQVYPEYARMEMPRVKDGSRIIRMTDCVHSAGRAIVSTRRTAFLPEHAMVGGTEEIPLPKTI